MILDDMAAYATAQAVTATGDTASSNSYDHGAAASIGQGAGPLWLVTKTVAAVVSAGGGTVQPVLQDSADNSTFADVMVLGPAAAVAAMGANKVQTVTRFPGTLRRYTRVAWRVGTAVLTAGTFSAFVVMDTDLQQYLASGFRVG